MGIIAAILFITFLVAGGVGSVFMILSSNALIKNRIHTPFSIALSVLFWGVLVSLMRNLIFALILIPVVAILAVWMKYSVCYCQSCGWPDVRVPFRKSPVFCFWCGSIVETA